MTVRNLEFLFRPRSVAVIGASNRLQSVGGTVMRNLLKGGFGGRVMPVSPKHKSIAGVHAYRDVFGLPETPDLALICTPAETLAQIVHELGRRGTRAVAILASTFHASGEHATGALQQVVLDAAKPYLLRILGPNSMGLIIPGLGLNASFAPGPAQPGQIAFISQSGALMAAALEWAASRDIGFSHVVSLGDAADVDAADTLDYLGTETGTRAILLYIESVRGARKFLSAARAVSRNKPIIVLKSGRTADGAQAAMRHTGCHPGNDQVFAAALRRAGMLRVHTIAELFAAAETLARMRSPDGDRLIILTNAGGPGVIATDALAAGGGELAVLAPETMGCINGVLPANGSPANPIDIGGDATATGYAETLQVVLRDPQPDAVLLIHGPSGVAASREIAEACATAVRESSRNVLACWMGGERARRSARALQEAGVPLYDTPEAAVQAFLHMLNYRRNQEALQEVPPSTSVDFAPDVTAVASLLHHALAASRAHLTEPEGKKILAAYGIPVVETYVAATADAAASLAGQIGYPVALKALSPNLEHRADVGGVMLNLEDEHEVRRAALDISRRMMQLRPDAKLSGFTVQRMIRRPGAVYLRHGAHELMLRAVEDPVFGPVVYLHSSDGSVAGDTAVGLLPLNAALAHDILRRTSMHATSGSAHRPAIDLDAAANVFTRVSQLLVDHPEIVELEIDPLLADDKGIMALEVRTRVAPAKLQGSERLAIRPYPRHLEQPIELGGSHFLLRPIKPGDARAYSGFIVATEHPDLHFRFFQMIRSLSAADLARYTQIDYDREMAFVALTQAGPGSGEIVGEVRAFRHPEGTTAEVGIMVRSDMKRRGLGRALLQKMIEHCKSSGIAELIGQILPDNEPMIGLARRCGMQVEHAPGTSVAVAHIDLRPRPAAPVKLF